MSITNVITRITVDMAGDVKRFAVKAKQYDRATRVIVVSLLWDEVPYVLDSADAVRCNVHKPDGTIAIIEGDNIAVSGNTVTITLPGTALTAAGRAWADIEIETQDESQQVSCQCFEIDIAKSPVDDDSIISTNEFSAMKLATKAANDAAAAATAEIEATAAAGTAASQAAAAAQAATDAANQAAAAATASVQIDATLTDNSKAAPAGMVGQIKEDLSQKADYSDGITVSDDTVGYLNTNGTLNSNSSWHCKYTPKISCTPGEKYRYIGTTNNNIPKNVLYFSGSTPVSQEVYSGMANVIVTIPNDVDGVIFQSADITANEVTLQVSRVYPETMTGLIEAVDGLKNKIDVKADYSDGITVSDDTPGRMTSSRVITDTSAWHCLYTNIIDVEPGWKFRYTGGTYNSGKAHCVFYLLDNNVMSSADYNIGETVDITIPDGVNQVWFQMATSSSFTVSMEIKRIYPASLDDFESGLNAVTDKLYGLKDGTLLPKYKVLKNEQYGYVGRWYDWTYNGVPVRVASAAGAEVCFKVSGTTSITINWTGDNVTEHVYYCYYIDGNAKVRTNVADNIIALPDTNEHIVRIVCDSIPHGLSVNCWTVGYGWVFGGVDAGNGNLKGIVPTNPTIMYFGDSLTEGVHAYGTESGGQVEADVDSATESYGFYASKYLGCSSVIVGYGSTGIINNGFFRKCIDAINYLTNGIETEDESPALIVINHGHNDTGTASEPWISAFNDVLARITTKYPGVEVVALSPFNRRHADDMKLACADKSYCHYVDTAAWGLGRYYADGPGHLTAEGARYCGEKLARAIRTSGLILDT